ncbi:MAG: flap endonuclease-1 [Halobacteriota archaeon]
MGADIGDLVEGRDVALDDLDGAVALDAYNAIYGFLANIRQRDGTPLQDSRGRVTSHLSGLLYRTANLYEAGVHPVYVFDGPPPDLKSETVERRRERKQEALESYEEAARKGDEAEMLKHAQRATSLDQPQVETSVALLEALRVPWMEAPSEGEAQAAYMCREGDVDYAGSQDYDSLLFGAPALARNLTIRGRKGSDLTPEVVELESVLDGLGLTREQLIEVAVLVGTDYNDGVHGVGPKTAVDVVLDGEVRERLREGDPDADLDAIKRLYMEPEVTDDYSLEWEPPDADAVEALLCDEHDFSVDRVRKAVERIESATTQSSLDRWS